MRTILATVLLTLALAGCEPYRTVPGYPEPYPPSYPDQYGPPMPPGPLYPSPGRPEYSSGAIYRASGTEPFWDLEIGRDLIFTDRGNNLQIIQPAPMPINGVAGEIYRTPRLEVNITHSQCSDGMSDRTYPDRVQVYADGRLYQGCGAPIAFFNQVGETGQPNLPGPPMINLNATNWRVVAINGIRMPTSNFYVNFMPDRIGARFGCNSLGAGYSQSGNILTVGAIVVTRMACPDMRFEQQGSAILMRPMTVSGIGDRITLSNTHGSIELVQAR